MNNVKVYRSKIGKSKVTTGNAYRIKVINKVNDRVITFTYNDNYLNESSADNILYCLYLDYTAGISCEDLDDFMNEYGYKEEREANKIYKAVLKNTEKVKYCFTEEQIEELSRLED